jgi:hypothetical protein
MKDAHMLAAFRQKLGQRSGVAIHEVGEHQIVGRRANRELQADDDAVAIALGAGPDDIERLRSGIAAHTVDGQPAQDVAVRAGRSTNPAAATLIAQPPTDTFSIEASAV